MPNFKLNATLALNGPRNTRQIVDQINGELRKVRDVNVKVNFDTRGLADLSKVKTDLTAISSSSSLRKLSNDLTTTSKAAKAATSDLYNFGAEAGLALKRAAAFTIATAGIYGLIRAFGGGIREAVGFEKEVVKLSQVTRISVRGLSGLTDEVDRLSTSLGVSSKELLDVSVTLGQAGLTARETKIALEALAKSALAPSFNDIKNTTEALIAITGQFKDEITGAKIEAKNYGKILGSINVVSNVFATEAEDITAAIRRTGAVFASASSGVGTLKEQLDQLVGIFTAVRSSTRLSADSIGNGLRTIFSRIQRPSTIAFLRQFGVELQDLQGKFVGPYEALKRLSESLSKLSNRDQRKAIIVEEIGGIRQLQNLIPAIENFKEAQRAFQVAQSGENSLDEEAVIAQQSLSNQLVKTRENFLKLVRDVTRTSSFKSIVELTLRAANGFITLADSIKGLIPLIPVIAAIRFGPSLYNEFGGGFVKRFRGATARASGGYIDGPGTETSDSISARLSKGEYVLRASAVKRIGVGKLDKMNRGYARGGYLGDFTPGPNYGGELGFADRQRLSLGRLPEGNLQLPDGPEMRLPSGPMRRLPEPSSTPGLNLANTRYQTSVEKQQAAFSPSFAGGGSKEVIDTREKINKLNKAIASIDPASETGAKAVANLNKELGKLQAKLSTLTGGAGSASGLKIAGGAAVAALPKAQVDSVQNLISGIVPAGPNNGTDPSRNRFNRNNLPRGRGLTDSQLQEIVGPLPAKSPKSSSIVTSSLADLSRNIPGARLYGRPDSENLELTEKNVRKRDQKHKVDRALFEVFGGKQKFGNKYTRQQDRFSGLLDEVGFNGPLGPNQQSAPKGPGFFARNLPTFNAAYQGIKANPLFSGVKNPFGSSRNLNLVGRSIQGIKGFGGSAIGNAKDLLGGNNAFAASFGALSAGAALSSVKPGSRSTALGLGGASGALTGVGLGIQGGLALGPGGAAAGAAIGGIAGAINGSIDSLNKFEKALASDKLTESTKQLDQAFSDLAKGTISVSNFQNKFQENFENAKETDKAGRFSISGSLLGEGGKSLGFQSNSFKAIEIGWQRALENTGFGKKGDADNQTVALVTQANKERFQTTTDQAAQDAPRLAEQLRAGRLGSLNKSQLQSLGLAKNSTKIFKQLGAEDAAGLIKNDEQRQKRLLYLSEQYGQTELKSLQKQIDAANKGKAAFQAAANSIDFLAERLSRMGEDIDRVGTIIDNSSARTSEFASRIGGNASVGRVGGTDVFSRRNSSTVELAGAFNKVTNFTGRSAGTDSYKTDLLNVKKFQEKLPELLQGLSGPDNQAESNLGKLRAQLTQSDLPSTIKAEVETALQGLSNGDSRDEKRPLQERLSEAKGILDKLTPVAQAYFDNFQKAANKVKQAQDAYAQALNQYNDGARKVLELRLEADRTLADASIRISERLGKDVSFGERTAAGRNRITALTGGETRPDVIARNSLLIQDKLNKLAVNRSRGIVSEGSLRKEASLVDALNKNKEALTELSKSTDELAAIEKEYEKVERKKAAFDNVADKFFGGGARGRFDLIREQFAVARFKGGKTDLRNPKEFEALKSGIATIESFDKEAGKKLKDDLRLKLGEVFKGPLGDAAKASLDEPALHKLEFETAKRMSDASLALAKLGEADLAATLKSAAVGLNEAAIELKKAIEFGALGKDGLAKKDGHAGGGAILGPGGPTSDSIPARLSNGEFVMRAAAVRRLGVGTLNHMNETGEIPGFASGGNVREGRRFAKRFFRNDNLLKNLFNPSREFTDSSGRARSYLSNNSPVQLRLLQRRYAFQQEGPTRRSRYEKGIEARRKRFRGFADGGLVGFAAGGIVPNFGAKGITDRRDTGGGNININSSAFNTAASQLSKSLENFAVPERIEMTGNHRVEVVINGAEVLNNLLSGPLEGLVRKEIEKAFNKTVDPTARLEGNNG